VDDGAVVRQETNTDHSDIGTTSPRSPLHIIGDGNRTLRIPKDAISGDCAVEAAQRALGQTSEQIKKQRLNLPV